MPPPDMRVWAGRVDEADGSAAVRWHQRVKLFEPEAPPGVLLLGFACDAGVRRNFGRVGAAQGPRAIREVREPMASRTPVTTAEMSYVPRQTRPAESPEPGGFCDLAVSGLSFSGRTRSRGAHIPDSFDGNRSDVKIGIVNIDSFRPPRDLHATSGTPFSQIAGWYASIECLIHVPPGQAREHGRAFRPRADSLAARRRPRSWRRQASM